MQDWKVAKKKLLKNKQVKAEYDKLEPEYQLARQLIDYRLKEKLTQTELARRAGVKQTVVARLESGSANPTIETVNKVARVLNKKIALV